MRDDCEWEGHGQGTWHTCWRTSQNDPIIICYILYTKVDALVEVIIRIYIYPTSQITFINIVHFNLKNINVLVNTWLRNIETVIQNYFTVTSESVTKIVWRKTRLKWLKKKHLWTFMIIMLFVWCNICGVNLKHIPILLRHICNANYEHKCSHRFPSLRLCKISEFQANTTVLIRISRMIFRWIY